MNGNLDTGVGTTGSTTVNIAKDGNADTSVGTSGSASGNGTMQCVKHMPVRDDDQPADYYAYYTAILQPVYSGSGSTDKSYTLQVSRI